MFKAKPFNPENIIKRDVQFPRGQEKLAFVLDNVFTKKVQGSYDMTFRENLVDISFLS